MGLNDFSTSKCLAEVHKRFDLSKAQVCIILVNFGAVYRGG